MTFRDFAGDEEYDDPSKLFDTMEFVEQLRSDYADDCIGKHADGEGQHEYYVMEGKNDILAVFHCVIKPDNSVETWLRTSDGFW
jgi:hypothetical protein